MTLRPLTKHHLNFLSLKGGCTCSSESTHVKMPHCWKSHVTAKLSFDPCISDSCLIIVFLCLFCQLFIFVLFVSLLWEWKLTWIYFIFYSMLFIVYKDLFLFKSILQHYYEQITKCSLWNMWILNLYDMLCSTWVWFVNVIYLMSVYSRNLTCFNRWQLYISSKFNILQFGWSFTNHWPRALFPLICGSSGLHCHLRPVCFKGRYMTMTI